MDFKSILSHLSQLSEGTKETEKGRVHTADPGGYGRKFDTDEEGDEKNTDKKEPVVKRGRGRPSKTGAHSQSPEEKKKLKSREEAAKELQSTIVGNVPKKSKELEKLPKKKHSIKEWIEEVEQKYISEAEQVTIAPAQSNTQVIKQGDKTLGTVTNPQLAATIKQAIGKGEMSLVGDELGESDSDYSAKKARAGKDIGKPGKNFAKIAKSAGAKYGSKEAGERVAGAVLAKLRANESMNEADIPSDQVDMGAGLGAGRSNKTFEGKKPDFLDLDKDKNKKEPMSDAAKDAEKKKKKLKENAHRHSSAKLLGKAHALAKEAYNCKFDDLDEVRMYHEGYKEGLDECYGQGVYEGVSMANQETLTMEGSAASKFNVSMHDRIKNATPQELSAMATRFAGEGSSYIDYEYELKMLKAAQDELRGSQGVTEGAVTNNITVEKIYDDGNTKEWHIHRGEEMIGYVIKNLPDTAEGLYIASGYGPGRGFTEDFVSLKSAVKFITSLKEDVTEGADAVSIWKSEAEKAGGYSNIDWYNIGFQHGKKGMFMNPPYGVGAKALALYSKGFDKAESQSLDEADMDEGNAFTAALAKTPKGGKFTVGGKSFTDTSNYGDSLDEMAFESLDKQLNALLNEDSVSEGMSVSITKGQQGIPDSVSVTAQDGEADQLLSIIKQSGLGLFGQDATTALSTDAEKHGEIDVVGDHDGMMSLIKKVTGATNDAEGSSNDYADEEVHDHSEEDSCNECGYMESECQCEDESVEETESYAQEEDIAAEDTEATEEQTDDEPVTEWANDVGQDADEFDEETITMNEKFMIDTISGGANKQKATGQTTIPVIASQKDRQETSESIGDWKKLAGLK